MSNFAIGMRFSSYDEFQCELQKYCEQNFHEFWKRDARRLQSACASKLKRTLNANPDLEYYCLKLCCIKGGRNFKKKKGSAGLRNTTTWKEGCPAFILLMLSRDGQFLEVTSLNLDHSHETSEVLHKMHPKNRRLPDDIQREAATLLQLGVSTRSLAQKLSRENNKTVLVKDLHNLAARLKQTSDDLGVIVETLQNTYNCVVNILHKDNVLEGLFFQDEEMYKAYESFPEILFFDGTLKLTKIGFVCYIFMVEDSNGSSEVVGVGLLSREDRTSVEWLVDAFKERNGSNKTSTIITDKDFVQRDIFKEKFPDAALLISLFHTLKAFRCEIACEKYGLKEQLKTRLKEYLYQLACSYTEEQYSHTYQKISSIAPDNFMAYFDEKWHSNREEWTRMICSTGKYSKSTNKRLECVNSKMKSIIGSPSSLSVFVDKFFVLIHYLRTERDNISVQVLQKLPTNTIAPGCTEDLYSKLLTPYAFKFLLKQLETFEENAVRKIENGNYNYDFENMSFPTNYNACSCAFFQSMKLPCRHILATRHDMGLCLYDEDLCDERWKRKNLSSKITVPDNVNSTTLEVAAENLNTQHQIYQAVSPLTARLTQIISESSIDLFTSKMEQISQLIRYWKSGSEVALVSVETASETIIPSSPAASVHEMESEETNDSNVSDFPPASIHDSESEENSQLPTSGSNVSHLPQHCEEDSSVPHWWGSIQLCDSKENPSSNEKVPDCKEPVTPDQSSSACIIRLQRDLTPKNSEPESIKRKATPQIQSYGTLATSTPNPSTSDTSTPKPKRMKHDSVDLSPFIAAALSATTKTDAYDSFGKFIADEVRSISDVEQQRMLKLKIQQLIYYAHKGWLQETDT